ncbi:hypothetical protein FRC01_005984, partial [Tulasnella sp. 417]
LLLKDRGHPSAVQLLGHALIKHSSVTKAASWDVFYLFAETERGSLWDLIQEQNITGYRIPEEKIMRIAINVVDIVALLHSSNPPLIHRNITPRNIIETTSGVFKLSSFLSVAFAPRRRFRTSELLPLREDLACFTATMYRSPEMMDLSSEAEITPQSDIWAVGVLLYMMCYGQHPFEGQSTEQIRQGEVPRRPYCNAYAAVDSFIVSILKKDPSARPTASALQSSLRAALKSCPRFLGGIPPLVFPQELRNSLSMPRESYLLRDLNGKAPSLFWYPDDVQAWVKAPMVPSRILKSEDATSDESPTNIPKRRGTLTGRTLELSIASHRRTQSLRHSRNNWFNLSEGALGLTNVPNTAPILQSNVDIETSQRTTSSARDQSGNKDPHTRYAIRPPKGQTVPEKDHSSGQERSASSFVAKKRTASYQTTMGVPRSSISQPEVRARPGSLLGLKNEQKPPIPAQHAESDWPSIEDIGSSVTYVSSVAVRVNGRFCDVFEGTHITAGKVALKRPRIGATGYDEGVIRLHETADAICYLHDSNVVHGDIKGNNILIGDGWHILLCDFGLTKVAPSGTSTSLKGAGTVRWQSPELWESASKTFASDMYAFGMTIVEVLKGEVPFVHYVNDVAVMRAVILDEERPSKEPISSPTGIPYKRAWEVAETCWAKEPRMRPSIHDAFRHLNEDPSLTRP